MARYFLDTHTFIWTHTAKSRLSRKARHIIESGDSELCLSVASVWEICTKFALKKLPLPHPPDIFIPQMISESGYKIIDLKLTHALAIAKLPLLHRDPFDRMLIVQSLFEGIPLLTNDAEIEKYPLKIIW